MFSDLFPSSLGDLLFSKLLPLRFRVSLEFGLTFVAVLDLLALMDLLDILFMPSMANLTFCELSGLRVGFGSLTGGALAMVGLKSGRDKGGIG